MSDTQLGSILAFAAMAAATCLLLALLCNIERFVTKSHATYSRALILIANLALLVRLTTEPTSFWTPAWPTYGLTFAGILSLGMIVCRIKTS